MRRTWKGQLARVDFYFLQGNLLLVQAKTVLYACAAFSVLGVPLWGIVALAPIIYLGHVITGYVFVQYGWYKQTQEVPVLEATNPVLIWQTHALIKILTHLHLDVNGVQVDRMPTELHNVWTGVK